VNDEELLEAALSRAAQLLPDDPDRIAGVRRARSGRRRQRRAAGAAAAGRIVAAAGTGIAVGRSRHPATRSTSVSIAAVGQLGATGMVVAVPGHAVRFCDTDVALADVGHAPGYIAPPPSDGCAGVDVTGVDLGKLADRRVQSGVVSGWAELRGTYAGGVLRVQQQGPPVTVVPTPGIYDNPPCPAPAGGWFVEPGSANSANPDVTAAQSYQAAHPSEVQQVAVLRPSAHQALVYVLTDGDPAAARAALSTDYPPDQLCVMRSAYTPGELAAVAAAPALTVGLTDDVESTGLGLDPATGQPVDEVGVVVETPAMRAAIARQPKGLVQLTAWLAPVR
jgi:hypothetical protein